jgi:hypothetical protein
MLLLTRIASGESRWGSRSKKGRLLKNNEGKNLKKIANPQAFSVE